LPERDLQKQLPGGCERASRAGEGEWGSGNRILLAVAILYENPLADVIGLLWIEIQFSYTN